MASPRGGPLAWVARVVSETGATRAPHACRGSSSYTAHDGRSARDAGGLAARSARADWRRAANAINVPGVCGRFTQMASWREVHAFLNLLGPPRNLRPRYNVAPTQDIAAVRAEARGRRLSMLRWGLIPGWATQPNLGYRLINARAETVSAKPAFRAAWRAPRRCLIPADGFFEWTRHGALRQPWLIGMKDGALFAFAGLWERWTIREDAVLKGALAGHAPGEVIETCTILTTAANETVAPIHHRMPVILRPEHFEPWLAGEAVALALYPPEPMRVQPVSTRVNTPSNDDPRCIEPVTLE